MEVFTSKYIPDSVWYLMSSAIISDRYLKFIPTSSIEIILRESDINFSCLVDMSSIIRLNDFFQEFMGRLPILLIYYHGDYDR